MNSVVVRYGEIGTKSRQTRAWFERILINNIREALLDEGIEYKEIFAKHGRIIVRTNKAREASNALVRVFGIVSLSPAMEVEASLEKINKTALTLFRRKVRELGLDRPRFRVTARRITKEFPLNSLEIQAKVGEFILNNEDCTVDLHEYDVEVGIEIMEGKAYIFTEKIKGWGGLPIGTQGKMVGLLQDELSALAIFLMMKRGVEVIPVHVGDNVEVARELWGILRKYSYGSKGRLVVVENIERVNKLISEFGAKGVVKGLRPENLEGELPEIEEDKRMFKVPVYYPLIALPDEYLEEVKEKLFNRN
ncbi:tRNA 4-thiouridine(8) synthase ThiI [Pyrococcus abyssi]|uniref:ThiI-like thiamin biosynthesis protein n=1 Tax=Pyrococcus abyssi (strain GE5 / Orsay) TaxID=272844 RepID=Q9V0F6_PYRAB|nr:tRNA 4-thiouridine(8) synthase ThiI [Pyrococcus abyssi]CAB49747.1 thiI-like thiamin biosynthesis protein [Pyrococcus abyssi GE5]CCE70235.1 TPA: thiamine biosynthesis protein ThiI [Pyrococcus abyssi GE5]